MRCMGSTTAESLALARAASVQRSMRALFAVGRPSTSIRIPLLGRCRLSKEDRGAYWCHGRHELRPGTIVGSMRAGVRAVVTHDSIDGVNEAFM